LEQVEKSKGESSSPSSDKEREREKWIQPQTSKRDAKENISKEREGQARESQKFLGARRSSKRETKVYAVLRRCTMR
jgi:hypothetical protein